MQAVQSCGTARRATSFWPQRASATALEERERSTPARSRCVKAGTRPGLRTPARS